VVTGVKKRLRPGVYESVTKDMARKFASPETYKALEKCVFTPKQEQKLEQTQSQGRSI